VRAEGLDQTNGAVRVSKGDQVFAQDAQANGVAVALR
jgi:hypothetical protein